jgi:hypothetical protein
MRWYVCCPPNSATGGTELLHQAAFKLRTLGLDAKMFYYKHFDRNPVPPRFKKYAIPWVSSLSAGSTDCLLIPEVAPDLLYRFPHSFRVFWWLSVDYFEARRPRGVVKKAWRRITGQHYFNFEPIPNVVHAAQSEYAASYLATCGIESIMLSDYLGETISQSAQNEAHTHKEDIIVYNPEKGIKYTTEIIDRMPQVQFAALKEMTPGEVGSLLKRSKIYIDFGSHPGKDRIPREAALHGCCVVVGRRGSANFDKDVAIPAEYKRSVEPFDSREVAALLNSILQEYPVRRADFDGYRERIRLEEQVFDMELSALANWISKSKR